MRVRRSQRKAPARRPSKSPRAKRRRVKEQRKRLVALGVPEEKTARLTEPEIRALLRHPEKTRKRHAVQ